LTEELNGYRKQIIEINSQILRLIKSRLETAKKIGELKKKRNLPIANLKVESDLINGALKLAREIDLDESLSSRAINILIAESVKLQQGVSLDRSTFLYNIFEKANKLELMGEKVIRLEVGEPDLECPMELKDALKKTVDERKFIKYCSSKGLAELRTAISENLNQKYGTDIKENQILITNGGKLAIFSAILSMVSHGDRVVIPEPTWPVYGSTVNLAKGRIDSIHTCFEDSWNLNMADIDEALTLNPKLFILCTPNNPTGKIFSKNLVEALGVSATRKGTYILSDEVYCAYSPLPFESVLKVLDSHFIYVNSFSKQYGMTGWRIGYAVSDPGIINKMQRILQISVTCVPEFIQHAALKALNMPQDPFTNYVKTLKMRLDVVCKALDRLPLSYVRPDGGLYIFPKVNTERFNSDVFAHKLLSEEKVAIAPGEAFGNYPEHFRLSLSTGVDNILAGIEKIGVAIKGWQKEL